MTLLDAALEELLATVDQDHQLVALALAGTQVEPPADAELAALVETVLSGRATSWSELFELHPDALQRHTAWATSQQAPRPVVDLTTALAPLAA